MKIILLILIFVLSLLVAAQEPKNGLHAGSESWIVDAHELLGEDMQIKFRAKDRLKDMDFLEDMLIKEIKIGKHKELALKVIHELKLVGVLPELLNLTQTTKEAGFLITMNHLSHKEDIKAILPLYKNLIKNHLNRDVGVAYLVFADYYNLKISLLDLEKIWSLQNEEVKKKLAEYLLNKRTFYTADEYSNLINRSLQDRFIDLRATVLNGMRGLPDAEAQKYSINYHVCRQEKDPKMNLNCKLMQKFNAISGVKP